MKKLVRNLILLSIFSITSLSLYSCSKEEEKPDDPILVPPDEATKEYTYGSIVSYEGELNSNLNIDLIAQTGINLNLLDTYITFSYQKANETVEEGDELKAIKFHLNLDLYSSQETFESSLLSENVIPLVFSDFKYQNILNNVSDLDLYYLGDGVLYTTISKLSLGETPNRNDRVTLRNAQREIIGTSKIDLNELLGMMDSTGSGGSTTDLIIQQLTQMLSGLSIKVGDITDIIHSAVVTILDNGFEMYLDEEGLSATSSLITSLGIYLLDMLDVTISIENQKLVDVSKFTLTYNPLEISLEILNGDSESSLIDLFLLRNDSNALNIEPVTNLEEDYLIQSKAVKAVDEFYSLYESYSLKPDYQTEVFNAISDINSLSDESKVRVANLNNYLGYEALLVDENGNFTGLAREEEIENLYNEALNSLSMPLSTDFDYLTSLTPFFNIFDTDLGDSIKFNIISYLRDTNSDEYNIYYNAITSYVSSFLDNIKNDIDKELNRFNETEKDLNSTKELLTNVYDLTNHNDIVLANNSVIKLEDLTMNSEILYLSNDLILEIADIFTINHPLFLDEYSQTFSNIVLSYLDEVKDLIRALKANTNVDEFSPIASLLVFGDSYDDLYNIFNLISAKNEQYYNTILRRYDNVTNLLLSKTDLMANNRLANVITMEEIPLLLTDARIDRIEMDLNRVFNQLSLKLDNPLFKKYSSNLTYIDTYYELLNELEVQRSRISYN